VLVQEVLEGGRRPGRDCFAGRGQTAQALDVHGDRGEDVLQVGLGLSPVAAATHAVPMGELVDGALHSGADRVAGFPVGRVLFSANADLQVAELLWGKPTLRAPSREVVHRARTGQGWHWALVNRATISGAAVGEEVG
jgi:hypothetical protein